MREGKIVIMSVKCKTAEELGKAIKNNEDTIEIEGNLKNEVFRIKATGKVAWGVCLDIIGIRDYSLCINT